MIQWNNYLSTQEYLEKLFANVNTLFNDKIPTDLHIAFEIIKLLITKGNLNLIYNNRILSIAQILLVL